MACDITVPYWTHAKPGMKPIRVPNPIYYGGPYCATVADGDAANPATWELGRIPTAADNVLVRHNIAGEMLAKGALLCAGVFRPTYLSAQTVIIHDGGLIIPHKGDVLLRSGPFAANDPDKAGNGIVMIEGEYGTEGVVRPTQCPIEGDVPANALALAFSADADLVPGDVLALGDSSLGESGVNQAETVTVDRVIDGRTVTLRAPTKFTHKAGRYRDGTIFIPMVAAVLSRTVNIRGDSGPIAERGHVMFLGGAVSDYFACYSGLGRARQDTSLLSASSTEQQKFPHLIRDLGRYPLHVHGADNATLEGTVVRGDNLGITPIAIHGANGCDLRYVSTWGFQGGMILGEHGNETGTAQHIYAGNTCGCPAAPASTLQYFTSGSGSSERGRNNWKVAGIVLASPNFSLVPSHICGVHNVGFGNSKSVDYAFGVNRYFVGSPQGQAQTVRAKVMGARRALGDWDVQSVNGTPNMAAPRTMAVIDAAHCRSAVLSYHGHRVTYCVNCSDTGNGFESSQGRVSECKIQSPRGRIEAEVGVEVPANTGGTEFIITAALACGVDILWPVMGGNAGIPSIAAMARVSADGISLKWHDDKKLWYFNDSKGAYIFVDAAGNPLVPVRIEPRMPVRTTRFAGTILPYDKRRSTVAVRDYGTSDPAAMDTFTWWEVGATWTLWDRRSVAGVTDQGLAAPVTPATGLPFAWRGGVKPATAAKFSEDAMDPRDPRKVQYPGVEASR